MITGRTKEIERILSVIRGPKDSALAISGSRGLGKSALLAQIPQLSPYRTVVMRASLSEADWPFSGLTALLNELDDPVLNSLADDLIRHPAGDFDIASVSTKLLAGLQKRSASRTVVVIDDADFLDPGSQAIIGFLARRLAGTEIALILSVSSTSAENPFASLPVLTLTALSYNDTVTMLSALASHNTAPALQHAVAAATQGNPLASVELFTLLLERNAEGKYALPIPLPSRGSFESEFSAKTAGLSHPARMALELLSLSYRTDIESLQKIPSHPWPGVDELLASGLVTRTGTHVRISDQLLRGYVFAGMAPASRTASHRLLAEAAVGTDPFARDWHLSFTALERHTPFGLLRAAADLIRNGEVPFAVEYIERALAINPWEAETAVRLSTVAELLFNRGAFVHAQRYLDWARRVTRNPSLILRLTGLSFQIQFMQGTVVRSTMVLRLIKEFGQNDPTYSACLLAISALYFADRWELTEAESILECAAGFEAAASEECLGVLARARLLVDAVRGNQDSVHRIADAGQSSPITLLIEARALSYAERVEDAQELFAMVKNSIEPFNENWRQSAAYFAVDNEIRAGNVRSAVRLIEDLDRSEPESKYHCGIRQLYRVWRAHALGDEQSAKVFVAEAQHFSSVESHPALTAQLAAWQGHFALLRDDLAEAYAQLSRATEIGLTFANPSMLRCETDLVEVLARMGRHREATQTLIRLEHRSRGLHSPWLMIAVARNRALLADGEKSLELFNKALELGHGPVSRLERARTVLSFAERLRVLGRARDARDGLLRAKVLFDEAGADAWTQHVDTLLLDERVDASPAEGNAAMLMLVDHERVLAQMVARGMRNKEIAANLFVSVRTVEVRLTAIYRKLGVESRAQLTALAAGKDNPTRESMPLSVH